MAFTQEALPYGYNDLAPHLDASVIEIHYTKHHAGYVSKLNAALEGTALLDTDLETLVADLTVVPEAKRAAVKKLAGQHYNHDLYWKSLSPNGGGAMSTTGSSRSQDSMSLRRSSKSITPSPLKSGDGTPNPVAQALP